MHPTSGWQDEQLHISPHKTPYDGEMHFWEQFTPVYPAGHSTNYNASVEQSEYGRRHFLLFIYIFSTYFDLLQLILSNISL